MAEVSAASQFVMYGAREAMVGGMPHIEEQIRGIERAVAENAGLAFDLAKTLIESACKTILMERGVPFEDNDDLPKLFKTVRQNVPFLPASASGEPEARKSLEQTLNGLNTALQGVCELRNAYGFASHGVEGPRPAMEIVQALLAAQAADAIVGFLYRTHTQDRTTTARLQLEYNDNVLFNQYVDDVNVLVQVFDLEYKPSEVLFSMDQAAYRDALDDYMREANQNEDDLPEAERTEVSA